MNNHLSQNGWQHCLSIYFLTPGTQSWNQNLLPLVISIFIVALPAVKHGTLFIEQLNMAKMLVIPCKVMISSIQLPSFVPSIQMLVWRQPHTDSKSMVGGTWEEDVAFVHKHSLELYIKLALELLDSYHSCHSY